MDYEMRTFFDRDWPNFVDLINDQWSKNHPILYRPLFDWQLGGFGPNKKKIVSLVVYDGDRMIGYRGVIPGLYQVPLRDGTMRVVEGGSAAMWVIHNDYRGQKLGFALQKTAHDRAPVFTAVGATLNTSVPIFRKCNFEMLDMMHRYIVPLELEGYHRLLVQKTSERAIDEWMSYRVLSGSPVAPTPVDLGCLASLWELITFDLKLFSLYRNKEFWQWRYCDNVGFEYLMFGDPLDAGVAVGRVERLRSDDRPELNSLKVFRLIEIIPAAKSAWEGQPEKRTSDLLAGVLRWAQDSGCVAADFFCSNRRFQPCLETAGFRRQPNHYLMIQAEIPVDADDSVLSLVPIFAPCRSRIEEINVLYRVLLPDQGFVNPKLEDTYIVKSEADMDRPTSIEDACGGK